MSSFQRPWLFKQDLRDMLVVVNNILVTVFMFSAHKPQMINNLRPIHQIIPKVFIVISKILCKVLINHHIMPRKRNGNHLHQHHDHHQRHHHHHQNHLHQIEGLGHHGHRPRKGVVAGWRRRLQQLPWVRESESHPHHLPIKHTHTHHKYKHKSNKTHTKTRRKHESEIHPPCSH